MAARALFSPHMVQGRGRSSQAESDVRDVFSTFDLFAALGTQFLSNACITSVTPVALLSAEAHKATSPLATSGGIAAATSIGMAISMACTYKRSSRWLDGKTPYVLFALLLIAGSGCYVVAEAIGARLGPELRGDRHHPRAHHAHGGHPAPRALGARHGRHARPAQGAGLGLGLRYGQGWASWSRLGLGS